MLIPLLFNNPVFRDDVNLTVRRGSKWIKAWFESGESMSFTLVDKDYKILTVQYTRFIDLNKELLCFEHDPICRTYEGLLQVMKETYPGFTETEYVTQLYFKAM